MKKFLVFVLVLPSLVIAQEKILLQGKVTNIKDVEGIHIMNTSSRYNSVTDQYGNFAITVKQNDTLIFSSVQYMPKKVWIDREIFEKELLIITLTEMVNELDEVILGPDLSGNLKMDIEKIPVKDQINFDDVGIPGFKGTPEEKIPPMIGGVIGPLSVNVEALYNHLSGYYRKLRLRRKWDAQNFAVAGLMQKYPPIFFEEAYHIPRNRVYDFLLFCIETTTLQSDFKNENYAATLRIFEQESEIYVLRLAEKEE